MRGEGGLPQCLGRYGNYVAADSLNVLSDYLVRYYGNSGGHIYGRKDADFGFTEKDMKRLCGDYGLSHKFGLIQEWYDGYVFGDVGIYNPWSAVKYVKDLLEDDGYGDIVYYGIAFYRKDCRVKIGRESAPPCS